MTWTWLERLFGGRIISELESERARADEAVGLLEEANKQITALSDEKVDLEKKLDDLHDQNVHLEKLIVDLKADVEWYESRVKALEEMLASAIIVPDISALLTDPTAIVEPYQHPELGRTHNHKMVYDLEVGDLEYLTWSKDVWLAIIDVMRPFIKEIHGRPKVPINDCENWAASMATFMAYAFRKAELEKQGALFVAWSLKHAYCGFVDLDGIAWIFDPMLPDYMIGELGQPLGEMYQTKDIWFT